MKQIVLETERLRIIPLLHSQLIHFLKNDGFLEEQLGVRFLKRRMHPKLIETFEEIILPAVGNPSKNYLFATIWLIISKETNLIIGEICCYEDALEKGEINLRFGLYSAFQKRGYMNEALRKVCNWAFEQPALYCIKTDTEEKDLATRKVLEKTGFSVVKPLAGNNSLLFKLSKKVVIKRA